MRLENLIRTFSKTKIGFMLVGCCHSYPDVFAFASSWKNNGVFTEYYCFECNRFFSKPLGDDGMTASFKDKIKKEGQVIYSSIEALEEIRKNALSNYSPK